MNAKERIEADRHENRLRSETEDLHRRRRHERIALRSGQRVARPAAYDRAKYGPAWSGGMLRKHAGCDTSRVPNEPVYPKGCRALFRRNGIAPHAALKGKTPHILADRVLNGGR